MTCPQCGHQNSAQARFCQECGARLPRRCSQCGGPLAPTAKFCPECAHPTGLAAAGSAATSARFASPESYTPRHLAEKILRSKHALEGERKQVTVLFADLKGSMELLAARDPEAAQAILDPLLERMMDAVHHYEGTVNQVMGDGIMALFGAPLAHEYHAVRACYAALRLQESVRKYVAGLRLSGVEPQIRVGLNSGEVVVRSVGSDLKMDYSAVGQTTHVAARMEQTAAPGTILLPQATLRLAEGYVKVRPQGRIAVKGLAEPMDVFELIGAEAARSRLQAAAARGLTRFVGRKAELEELERALERARRGQGQVVAVIAEAGVGKSRLLWEFLDSRRDRDWLILETGCISHRQATAYLPIIELLRSYFQIEDGDPAGKIREKVVGKLLSRDLKIDDYLPAYLWLLEALEENSPWQQLPPEQRRQRTVEGVRRLLLHESHVQPLILVFEDLHWIDAETQALLDGLVDSLPATRILLLVNHRPEYRHPWGGKSYYRHLRLQPLPPETAEELLEMLLGADPALDRLKQRLIALTEGNPFFLEESVRTLRETRVLTGERGAYRLSQPVEAIQVPPTVQAILAARIDRLPEDEKRLLQSSSVVGVEVPLALLREIADTSDEDLHGGLARLQASDFLFESRLFPEIEYGFRHALTHDVVYASVLHDRRRALHGRIVDAIERSCANRLSEHVERLAHHAFRGQVWTKALPYLRQAGTKAHGRSANREAVGWFEQALVALRHLPETRETREAAIDVRLDLRGSLYPLGEFDTILGHLREAEALAQALGDSRRLGWIRVHTGEALRQMGWFAEARTLYEGARAVADPEGDWPLALVTHHYLGALVQTLGDSRRGVELLRTAVQIAEAAQAEAEAGHAVFSGSQAGSLTGFRAVSLSWLTRCLAECGDFVRGLTEGRASLAVAERLDHPYCVAAATFALGHLYAVKGELEPAIRLLERALATAREWNVVLYRPQAMRGLGWAYVQSDRLDEGLALLELAVTEVEARHLVWQHVPTLGALGEGRLRAGFFDEAATVATRALTLARERAQRGEEASALRLLGEIALARDSADLEEAVRNVRDALTLATSLGLTPLAGRCHLDYGKLLRRAGKHHDAATHLSAALTVFRDLEMTLWLRRAEAEVGRSA
ncbi:MAG: AAA family ATPase [Candidatus Rokuibacteriota bacterium]